MGDVTKVNPEELLAKSDIQDIVKEVGFNPTQTSNLDLYPTLLMWRLYVDDKRMIPSNFDNLLSDMIDGIALSEFQTDTINDISDEMFSKISNGEFSKVDIYHDAFLVCWVLFYRDPRTFSEKPRTLHSLIIGTYRLRHPKMSNDDHYSLVEQTLQQLQDMSEDVDTYEKLNDVFKPYIDNLYHSIKIINHLNPA
jgi:hypothetical protein